VARFDSKNWAHISEQQEQLTSRRMRHVGAVLMAAHSHCESDTAWSDVRAPCCEPPFQHKPLHRLTRTPAAPRDGFLRP
jgi:hypothetical protein